MHCHMEAQFSMLNGMVLEDFNGDGNLDLLLNGNDFGTEVPLGRYDALNGLVLLGLGDGNFKPSKHSRKWYLSSPGMERVYQC